MTALLAGREMDALVHEHIFGQHVHDWQGLPWSGHARRRRYECSICHERRWGGQANEPPRYSSSPIAAELVIAQMIHLGWTANLHCNSVAIVASFDNEWRHGYSSVWNYPPPQCISEALSRAALNALHLLPVAI